MSGRPSPRRSSASSGKLGTSVSLAVVPGNSLCLPLHFVQRRLPLLFLDVDSDDNDLGVKHIFHTSCGEDLLTRSCPISKTTSVRTVKSKQRNVKDLATILVSDQPIQNIVFRRTHPTQGGRAQILWPHPDWLLPPTRSI